MNLTADMFTFIPVPDLETYYDYDLNFGFCGEGQLDGEEGIIVLTSDKSRHEENVEGYKKWLKINS